MKIRGMFAGLGCLFQTAFFMFILGATATGSWRGGFVIVMIFVVIPFAISYLTNEDL